MIFLFFSDIALLLVIRKLALKQFDGHKANDNKQVQSLGIAL